MSKGERQGGVVAGIILVLVGLVLLLINFGVFRPEILIAALGASLVAYIFWRLLGFLIPGMILLWLGSAIALVGSDVLKAKDEGSIILIALGLAFVSIYAFMGRRRHWWPLIPGGILLILGIIILLISEGILPLTATQLFNIILSIALVLIGIWLIIRRFFYKS
jgi:hypothetical protein